MTFDPLNLEDRHRKRLSAKQRYDLWKLSAEQKRQKRLSEAIETLKVLYSSETCSAKELEANTKIVAKQGLPQFFNKHLQNSAPEEITNNYFVAPFEIGKRLAYYLEIDKQFDAAWRVYGDLQSQFTGDWYYQEKIALGRASMLKKEKRIDHAMLHFSLSHVYGTWSLIQRIEGIKKTAEYINNIRSAAAQKIFGATRPEDE